MDVQKFQDLEGLPKSLKVIGKLLVTSGPEHGAGFAFLERAEGTFVLGRGDGCDLQLLDAKASRRHAEVWIAGGSVRIRDLGSANGLKVNDKRITEVTELFPGDEIELGSSRLEWVTDEKVRSELSFEAVSGINLKEKTRNEPVRALAERTNAAHYFDPKKPETVNKAPAQKREGASSSRGRFFVGVAVLGVVLVFVLESGNKKKTPSQSARRTSRGPVGVDMSEKALFSDAMERRPASLSSKYENPTVEIHLHQGARELREGNYGRALREFMTVLAVEPGEPRAMREMTVTRKQMDKELNRLRRLGVLEFQGGRYSSAANHFCQMMRILTADPDQQLDTRVVNGSYVRGEKFKSTKELYEKTIKRMDRDEDQTHCKI